MEVPSALPGTGAVIQHTIHHAGNLNWDNIIIIILLEFEMTKEYYDIKEDVRMQQELLHSVVFAFGAFVDGHKSQINNSISNP